MKLFREELGDELPIVGCYGNHDLWFSRTIDKFWRERYKTVGDVLRNFDRLCDEYKILNEFVKDGVAIFSYNSWYKGVRPPSNDATHMPKWDVTEYSSQVLHQRLIERSYAGCNFVCEKLRESDAQVKIVVTHFQPKGSYRGGEFGFDGMNGSEAEYQKLVEAGAHVLCYGHSHNLTNMVTEVDCGDVSRTVWVLNSGSDYDKPKYKIFELDNYLVTNTLGKL
jgi:hypothetical protein